MRNNRYRVCGLALLALLASALAPCLASGETSVVIKADEQFQFAESYFERGEYYRAISEYERFMHFFPEDNRVELAMFKVGESYFKGERFKEAIHVFRVLIQKNPDTGLAVKSYFRIGECHVKLRQLGMALTALDNLLRKTGDTDVKDKVFYRQGWIYLEMDQWEKAQASFDRISPKNKNTYRLHQLSEDLNKKKSLKTKSPYAAGWLAVIPGAGHLYCERYRDAFIAFLLNGGMILAAIEAFDNDNEALGGLITLFEIGLYSGNIYSAVGSAHKHNRKQEQDFLQYLKDNSSIQASAVRLDEGNALALSCKISF